MQRRTREEIDGALMDALASYAMALQALLRGYADADACRCPCPCRRCEATALLDSRDADWGVDGPDHSLGRMDDLH